MISKMWKPATGPSKTMECFVMVGISGSECLEGAPTDVTNPNNFPDVIIIRYCMMIWYMHHGKQFSDIMIL